MNLCDEIRAARCAGLVRCSISPGSRTLGQLTAESGLSPDRQIYHEISAADARQLAYLILVQDLAYGTALVDPALANSLLDRFFAAFGSRDVQFFTNGTFHLVPESKAPCNGVTWQPATSATFDTGVLILGPIASGVLWVEDED